MTRTPLDPAANTQWSTKTELTTLANAGNVPGVTPSRGYDTSNVFGCVFWKPVAS